MRRRRQKGQALVETALIAPVLLTLLLGGAQLGAIIYDQLTVDTAAREAARVASANPKASAMFPAPGSLNCGSTPGNLICQAVVKSSQNQQFGLIDPNGLTTTGSSVTYGTAALCSGVPGTADDGLITVTVSYNAPIFVPFVNRILATSGQSYRTVTTKVTVRVAPCATNGGN